MAKKRTDERNGENAEGEEPNFEDPEDFVDDISDQGINFFTPGKLIKMWKKERKKNNEKKCKLKWQRGIGNADDWESITLCST